MVVRKRLYALTLSCLCWLAQGWGTELQPWLGNIYEFEWRNDFCYQQYENVDCHSHLLKYKSNDFFVRTSLSNTLAAHFAFEVETMAALTRYQKWELDYFRLSGRYQLKNDLLGDAISLTMAVSLTQSFVNSLHDVSSFHHGRNEAELFILLGRENSGDRTWQSRWWGGMGVGLAERGSAWLRHFFVQEFRLATKHEIALFAEGLWGLGHQSLHLHHFKGYGSIQHASIDVGMRYTHLLDFFGNLGLEYSQRVYARNFPAYTHRFLFHFLYTFGL